MASRIITFKIPEELLERVDKYAKYKHVSRSQLIREALERFIEEQERARARVERIHIF